MKRIGCKNLIREILKRNDGWVSKGVLYSEAYEHDYSPENITRRCREMEEAGEIQVSYYTGKYNQQLARYASLKVEKPRPPKIEIKEIEGRMVAVLV